MTEGQASISADILARYAGDAALEVDGVRRLAGRRGVKIEGDEGAVRVELHLVVDWGASIPDVGRTVQQRVAEYLGSMADVQPESVDVIVVGLTGATLPTVPTVCHECTFWQSPKGRSVDKARWIRGTEEEWGAWGTVYYDDDGRLLGSMQYGPSDLFPRAGELPAGPPSPDALLVTCAFLVESSTPWVMQSLFLTAIGDARDKGARAVEAFAYRYGESDSTFERFQVHKTIFPSDFLADFGFVTVRTQGSHAGTRVLGLRDSPGGEGDAASRRL